jgi:hypothetical protein
MIIGVAINVGGGLNMGKVKNKFWNIKNKITYKELKKDIQYYKR